MKEVALRKVPIEIVERQLLGFTHAESGRILAEPWRLPADISDVIEYHAAPEKQKTDKSLTALVQITGLACHSCGLGLGYEVVEQVPELDEVWSIIQRGRLLRRGASRNC